MLPLTMGRGHSYVGSGLHCDCASECRGAMRGSPQSGQHLLQLPSAPCRPQDRKKDTWVGWLTALLAGRPGACLTSAVSMKVSPELMTASYAPLFSSLPGNQATRQQSTHQGAFTSRLQQSPLTHCLAVGGSSKARQCTACITEVRQHSYNSCACPAAQHASCCTAAQTLTIALPIPPVATPVTPRPSPYTHYRDLQAYK